MTSLYSVSAATETFESVSLPTNYAGPVYHLFENGIYECSELVIGKLPNDHIHGKKGLRLRNNKHAVFAMTFDTPDIHSIEFYTAKYGHDSNSVLRVEKSCDAGISWSTYAGLSEITVQSYSPVRISGKETLSDPCRLRLKSTSTDNSGGNRVNIDNWNIQYTSSGICENDCGDGVRECESCDDGNIVPGDGCSSICEVEQGYTCSGEPSVCVIETGCNITMCDNVGNGKKLRECLRTACYVGKHITHSYTAARKEMYNYIDNINGTLTCVYGGYVHAFTHGGTSTPGSGPINCEHTLPQSSFRKKLPMVSDLHHLFPTHPYLNSARSNYPFAELDEENGEVKQWYISNSYTVTDPITTNQEHYSELSSDKRWEPATTHKGNVARAMMYMFTMYEYKLDFRMSKYLADMTAIAWHTSDPVDVAEITRDSAIAAFQGTHNPFVLDASLANRAFL